MIGSVLSTACAWLLTAAPAAPAAPAASSTSSTIAITGAKIELGDGTVLDRGTVVVVGGKISAVGANVAVPAGAERVDGTGKVLTPGLICIGTQVGLVEVGLERATVDSRMSGQAVPAFRAIDGFNPASPRLAIDREQGVTREVLTPQGALLYGQGYLVDLSGDVTSAQAARRVAMVGGFASGARDAAGGARGAVLLRLREIFDDVRFYAANKAAYDRAGARALTLPRVHLEALIDVVDGKLPLVFDVNRASDIIALLAFAQEQKIRAIINGGAEAWVVAKELAAAKVPVILEPFASEPATFDSLRARDDNAALLAQAGVTLALSSGGLGLGTTRLRQEAGVAVGFGLGHEAALAAITSNAARIFGVDDLGVIAVGKRADLVLWSGDPFETGTDTELVLIDGKRQSLQTRQTMLVDKYRQLP